MAGPGWVKEWNWGHHDERTTHVTGIPPAEIQEVYDEMDQPKDELDKFFISRGVNGALQVNIDGIEKIKELWHGVEVVTDKSTSLANQFTSTVGMSLMEQKRVHIDHTTQMVFLVKF